MQLFNMGSETKFRVFFNELESHNIEKSLGSESISIRNITLCEHIEKIVPSLFEEFSHKRVMVLNICNERPYISAIVLVQDIDAKFPTPKEKKHLLKVTKVSFPYKENITNTSGGGGNQIYLECEVDEDVTYTVIYAHLYPDTAKVKTGDTVKAGDELAGVGTTGYSTGPHLHYQVELNENKVDGMSLIDFADNTPNFNQYPDLAPDHNYNFNNNYNNQFRP